jgi:hypothetical protein
MSNRGNRVLVEDIGGRSKGNREGTISNKTDYGEADTGEQGS